MLLQRLVAPSWPFSKNLILSTRLVHWFQFLPVTLLFSDVVPSLISWALKGFFELKIGDGELLLFRFVHSSRYPRTSSTVDPLHETMIWKAVHDHEDNLPCSVSSRCDVPYYSTVSNLSPLIDPPCHRLMLLTHSRQRNTKILICSIINLRGVQLQWPYTAVSTYMWCLVNACEWL